MQGASGDLVLIYIRAQAEVGSVLCLPSSMQMGNANPLARRSALFDRYMGNSLTFLIFPCSPKELELLFY